MDGFKRLDQPGKRVIIIGAGMAGLVAAYELARSGHDPLILEEALEDVSKIHPRIRDGTLVTATPIGAPIA